jgi:DNA-binding transcriptional LysR family regulator
MDIRQLQYLSALAREKHFSRAAAACHVTQPTLSERIRQLEEELGVAIVERGHKFHGLTAEGERVLKWAQVILESCDAMRQELTAQRGDLSGRLTLGVIPSGLSVAANLMTALRQSHPRLNITVLSQTSEEIRHSLEDFSIDAGLTYLDNEPLDRVISQPLYQERYRLFMRHDHPLARRKQVTWAEVAAEPLCLLTSNMQNRRIINGAFRGIGARVEPAIESNSIINLCANIRYGNLASVLPEAFIELFGKDSGLRAVPIVDPFITHIMGLVVLDRTPLPPILNGLMAVAQSLAAQDA